MLPSDDENAWNEYVKKQNERVINILKSHGAVEKHTIYNCDALFCDKHTPEEIKEFRKKEAEALGLYLGASR